jgi:uncharacterized cupin superfamily protein
LAEFLPLKKNVDVRPHVHSGFEFLYVLSGEMELRHGSQAHTLSPGDSVYFDASTPHSYRCAGDEVSRVIIVTQHQAMAARPSMHLRPLETSLRTAMPAGTTAEHQKGEQHSQQPTTTFQRTGRLRENQVEAEAS